MSPIRLRLRGVHPIELWDHPVDGVPLYERVGAGRGHSAEAIADALSRATPSLLARTGAARIWLGGGLAASTALQRAMSDDRVSFAPPDLAWRGATSLARATTLLDLGQTAAKLITPAWRLRLARPASLPVAAWGQPRPDRPDPQGDLLAWLVPALRLAPPGPRVLALPCEVGDGLALGDSTYAGLVDGLPDRLVDALPPAPTWVVNDAELAGIGAVACGAPPGTLVITLGYAPGGALVG